mmetsp:Transcript_17966/g.54084  ORF Transcript_17966/g.54084 Transcript_17966/m.54084 type:complete len:1026 (-) Transcript_17966:920-3997(-)
MSIAGSEGSTAGMAKSMPRVMPRAHIASTMGTRFPLVKGTYFKDDVAGVVNLLYFTDQDAPKAAQAFQLLLCLHLGDAQWEKDMDQKFDDVDGASAMLTLLSAQPDMVHAINKPGRGWVPWGAAKPLTDVTGPALARVAAFTKNQEAWLPLADWLSATPEMCQDNERLPATDEMTDKLAAHLNPSKPSKATIEQLASEPATRVAFSLACNKSAAYMQLLKAKGGQKSGAKAWLQSRGSSSRWEPLYAALVLACIFTRNEDDLNIVMRAINNHAVQTLLELVHTWDDGADWRGRPDHAPKTELTAAMQGLINAVEAHSSAKELAKKALHEDMCKGGKFIVQLLALAHPNALQLQAAKILQAACSPDEIRKWGLTDGRVMELATSHPDFQQLATHMGMQVAQDPFMPASSYRSLTSATPSVTSGSNFGDTSLHATSPYILPSAPPMPQRVQEQQRGNQGLPLQLQYEPSFDPRPRIEEPESRCESPAASFTRGALQNSTGSPGGLMFSGSARPSFSAMSDTGSTGMHSVGNAGTHMLAYGSFGNTHRGQDSNNGRNGSFGQGGGSTTPNSAGSGSGGGTRINTNGYGGGGGGCGVVTPFADSWSQGRSESAYLQSPDQPGADWAMRNGTPSGLQPPTVASQDGPLHTFGDGPSTTIQRDYGTDSSASDRTAADLSSSLRVSSGVPGSRAAQDRRFEGTMLGGSSACATPLEQPDAGRGDAGFPLSSSPASARAQGWVSPWADAQPTAHLHASGSKRLYDDAVADRVLAPLEHTQGRHTRSPSVLSQASRRSEPASLAAQEACTHPSPVSTTTLNASLDVSTPPSVTPRRSNDDAGAASATNFDPLDLLPEEIKSDLHEVLEELASGDDGEAQDAAVTLVMRMKSCGAGAAVPAALVAQNAVPALEELARKLPHKEHVQQLLRLCHVARDARQPVDGTTFEETQKRITRLSRGGGSAERVAAILLEEARGMPGVIGAILQGPESDRVVTAAQSLAAGPNVKQLFLTCRVAAAAMGDVHFFQAASSLVQ